MHVFNAPELKITLSGNQQYAAASSTASGAPFRAITVRDTIGDLPAVVNGASKTNLEVFKYISRGFPFKELKNIYISDCCLYSIKMNPSHGFKRKLEGTWQF